MFPLLVLAMQQMLPQGTDLKSVSLFCYCHMVIFVNGDVILKTDSDQIPRINFACQVLLLSANSLSSYFLNLLNFII